MFKFEKPKAGPVKKEKAEGEEARMKAMKETLGFTEEELKQMLAPVAKNIMEGGQHGEKIESAKIDIEEIKKKPLASLSQAELNALYASAQEKAAPQIAQMEESLKKEEEKEEEEEPINRFKPSGEGKDKASA